VLRRPVEITRLIRQVEFVAEKCKCDTEGYSAAHWATRVGAFQRTFRDDYPDTCGSDADHNFEKRNAYQS
jgi:hypothetical protein